MHCSVKYSANIQMCNMLLSQKSEENDETMDERDEEIELTENHFFCMGLLRMK